MRIITALHLLCFFVFPASAQPPVLKIPTAHTGMINGFDVSHNGRLVATCSGDFTIKLWDYRTKKELKLLTGHTGSVNAVRFSPNDSLLVSGSMDTKMKIWRVSTGECIATIDSLFNRWVYDVCFSPNGKLVAGGSSNSVGVWNLETKKIVADFGIRGACRKVSFFPDNSKVACADADSLLSVWNLVDSVKYMPALSFWYSHGDINDFFISKDGKTMFAAVNTTVNNIRIHNTGGKDTLRFHGHTNPARAICPGENDDVFYSISKRENAHQFRDDLEIKKWSISSRKCIDSFYVADHDNNILTNQVKLSPQKELLISNYRKLFFATGSHVDKTRSIRSRTSITNGIFKKDSLLILTAEDGVIRSFNTSNNILKLRNSYTEFVSASFLNQHTIVTNQRNISKKNYSTTVISQNLETAKNDTLLNEANVYIRHIPGVNFSADGTLMAYRAMYIRNGKFLSDSARFKILDTENKKTIRNVGALDIASVKFMPDHKSFVWSSGNSNAFFLTRDSTSRKYSDTIIGKNDFYKDLEVLDSNHVICADNNGATLWNLTSGKIEDKFEVFNHNGVYIKSVLLTLSKEKNQLLLAQEDSVKLFDISSRKILQSFSAGAGWVNKMAFANDSKTIVTSHIDNSIRVWDVATGKEKYKIIFIDTADWIVVSPQGYYQSTTAAAKLLHYATKDYKFITFEQLDTKYNRPDKVLEAVGSNDTALIDSYRKAYQKRIKRLAIDTSAFRDNYGVPEADFENRNAVAYDLKKENLVLKIKGSDPAYKLDRFNIWVNEVPLYAKKGQNLRNKNTRNMNRSVPIKLSQGINHIETSVSNINGTESYRMPLVVNYQPEIQQKERLHFVGIGIDRFLDAKYNLQYSCKDIRDLAKKLKSKFGNDITIDTLFNENVTVKNVKALKKGLLKTSVNDKVIVSYSGHGLLSKDFDYFLSTYSINFEHPDAQGLPYDELENLLDGIPARKKLLLIDACHSGEVDKEEMEKIKGFATDTAATPGAKGVIPLVRANPEKLGMKNSFELMQQLFVNVGRSTGATVISAAAGTQFAQERGELQNGVFTYAILEAMNNHATIKISELKKIVGERVEAITKGLQKPTSRNETIAVDWNIW